ncbi:MAG TPA: hypothetical protein VL944_03130, partial [Candidatus Acidoferrum sp.]|nr:hypothetical protein [Candidatus Acidoferrum sp.]
MLFDGGVKEVRADELEELLNKSFDSKISSLDNRMSNLLSDIERARGSFLDNCERFEKNSATPDRESIRFASEHHIMEQKAAYIGALRRVLGVRQKAEGKNLYLSYRSGFESSRSLLDEILKINNKFRIVLEGYANLLGGFKSSYTNMERTIKELGSRLEMRSREFAEYNVTLQEIESFISLNREIAELGKALSNVAVGAANDPAEREDSTEGMRKDLSERVSQIHIIEKGIEDARSTIMAKIAPLDKPARKYEHGLSKSHLTAYLDDPMGVLNNEANFRELCKDVTSLKKEIEEGRIVVKNRAEAMQAIDFVLNESIISFLNEIEILKGKRAVLMREIGDIEKSIRDIESVEEGRRKKRAVEGSLKENMDGLKSSIDSSKRKIEQLFEMNYRRKVKV